MRTERNKHTDVLVSVHTYTQISIYTHSFLLYTHTHTRTHRHTAISLLICLESTVYRSKSMPLIQSFANTDFVMNNHDFKVNGL